MEKTTKILLIACVILMAALSLTIGLVIGNQLNTPSVLNTTNNTTPTVNNTVNQSQSVQNTTTKKSSDNNTITANQAANIALAYVGSGWNVIYVGFETSPSYIAPCYQVEVRDNDTHISEDVYVNAQSGAIMLNPHKS